MDDKQTRLIHGTMLIILVILTLLVILAILAIHRDRVAKCRQSVTLQASQGEDCNWSECTPVSLVYHCTSVSSVFVVHCCTRLSVGTMIKTKSQ